MKNKIAWLFVSCLVVLSLLLASCGFLPGVATNTIISTVTVTAAPVTVTPTPPATIGTTPIATIPNGQITNSNIPTGRISNTAIRWTSPNQIIFTWSVSNLSPDFEYWVYPRVGFSENSSPFGSTPQDEANDLLGMYDAAVTRYRSASAGTGTWGWGGAKPTNPTGQLALLAYKRGAVHYAFVVALSSPINTSSWLDTKG